MTITIKRRPIHGDVFDPSLPSALDRVFRARKVSSSQQIDNAARNLLHYKGLKHIDVATDLLYRAIADNKNIVIVGDFDADGATSTALCLLCMRAMGVTQLDYLVPNRFDFGYGLSTDIVEVAKQQGAEVIITVDSGIACFDGVKRAKQLGIKVIITDHHLPAQSLPEADAIVNPNQADCQFASKNLAGVGVAFYLMSALKAKLSKEKWFHVKGIPAPNMANWLDIVAIGTIADVVPLDQNNRILVYQGLQRIRAGRCRAGIKAMLDIAGRANSYLAASDLGFVIGPRLNAAGRLQDMALGIECLLAEDTFKAREMAAELDSLNQKRKQLEQSMRADAERVVSSLLQATQNVPSGLVVYDESYHQGIIGIVAGRLREKFNRPTVTFAKQDEHSLKGSGRSIPGIHIRDVFEAIDRQNPTIIDKFGGHAMAAGLSIPVAQLDAFTDAFNRVLTPMLEQLGTEEVVYTDGELVDAEFNLDFAMALKQAGPFGQGFENPCFDNQFTLVSQRIVGEQHLKMQLATNSGQTIEAIAFNVDTSQWPNAAVKKVHAVHSPDINVYRNKTSLQLIVSHIQAC